jgi:hypothetical protein
VNNDVAHIDDKMIVNRDSSRRRLILNICCNIVQNTIVCDRPFVDKIGHFSHSLEDGLHTELITFLLKNALKYKFGGTMPCNPRQFGWEAGESPPQPSSTVR